MLDGRAHIRSELEGYIGRHSHSRAFRVGPEEMAILGWKSEEVLKIGFSNYQVVKDGREEDIWYLFKMTGKKPTRDCSLKGDVLRVGKRTLSVMDLVGWKPKNVDPETESIAVSKSRRKGPPNSPGNAPPPVPPPTPPIEGDIEVPNAWFTENFRKYARRDALDSEEETPMNHVAK